MPEDDMLRECLISTLGYVEEQQKQILQLVNKMTAVEDILRAARPGAASALGNRDGIYEELSDSFDKDITMQSLGELIQRLKGGRAQ